MLSDTHLRPKVQEEVSNGFTVRTQLARRADFADRPPPPPARQSRAGGASQRSRLYSTERI